MTNLTEKQQLANQIRRDRRWLMLVGRDPQAEGKFLYSVTTSGNYCRPVCNNPLPKPEHVSFYATIAEAEAAGFRPCPRCQPNKKLSARELSQLLATIKKKSGGGEMIHYGVGKCLLGNLLVAKSEWGICSILIGDNKNKLVQELQVRLPKANLLEDNSKVKKTIAEVADFISSPHQGYEFDLDIRGTPFQKKVWEAVRKVPPGETASYSEIAQRIKSPNAMRAVGTACSANPMAIVIPCHRVVRSDGTGGFRWGASKKEILLKLEAPHRHPATRSRDPVKAI